MTDTDTPSQSPSRETQLEMCLTGAREMIADLERRHEAAERAWAQTEARLLQRIEWLEGRIAGIVVRESKQ